LCQHQRPRLLSFLFGDGGVSEWMRVETRHGWLLGVVGTARCSDGIWFAPVRGEVEDPEEYPTHPLHEHAVIRFDCEGFELGDADGVWVRAALPGVFGYAPLHVSDGRWFLLDAAFAAVLPDGEGCWAAYPFACTDAGLGTGLVFSRRGPPSATRDRIARAFWGLLVAEGAERLSPFTAAGVGFDTGDGYDSELVVGYARGTFFAEDMRDPSDE
jgi:hypothetical protein